MLSRGVPGADNEYKPRTNTTLKEPLDGAERNEVREVFREPNAQDGEPPEDDVHGQDAAHGIPLQQQHGRHLEEQVRDVEDGGEPRELLAHEPRVLAQPERRLRADARLVDGLQAVAQEHEREEVAVYLAS